MDWIERFIPVVTFAGAVVMATIYLFSFARRGRADLIRTDNGDLRDSNQELRTERAMLEERVKNQDDQIRMLKEMATQTPAVKELIKLIADQQKQASEHHNQVIEQMGSVSTQLGTLAGAISKGYDGRRVKK